MQHFDHEGLCQTFVPDKDLCGPDVAQLKSPVLREILNITKP